MELTTLARIPLMLLERTREMGLSRRELLSTAGLTEEMLSDPDTRIPASRIEALWRTVIARHPDPAMGIQFGASISARELGIVGYTMAYSPTLDRALQRMARFSRVVSEAIEIALEVDRAEITMDGGPRFDTLKRPVDSRLAALLAVTREITATDLVPREVRFGYEKPADTSQYAAFFRCPLRFGQPVAALAFYREDLGRRVVTADKTLVGYLDRLADEALESLSGEDTFVGRVRRAIWKELSDGRPNLKRTALVLGTSARTLQRRLTDEGTTFASVLEAFRKELASGLLRNRELSIYEIAFLLGYSEPSTFHRAFRRWNSSSPQEFRRTLD
jgi:AraC-like DNA-binding protein